MKCLNKIVIKPKILSCYTRYKNMFYNLSGKKRSSSSSVNNFGISNFDVSDTSGPARKSPKWTFEELQRAIELVRSGMPIKPAAEHCNIPVMTLWRRTRALGVVSSRAMAYSIRTRNKSATESSKCRIRILENLT